MNHNSFDYVDQWCTRNKLVFKGTHSRNASTIALNFSQLHISQRAFDNSHSLPLLCPYRKMCWQHNDNDTLILNVDGNALINTEQSVHVGLLCSTLTIIFSLVFIGSWDCQIFYTQRFKLYYFELLFVGKQTLRKIICFRYSLHVIQLLAKKTPS